MVTCKGIRIWHFKVVKGLFIQEIGPPGLYVSDIFREPVNGLC